MGAGATFPLSDVVNGAVGAFDPYCMGYQNPGASGGGYVATMKLSVDKVDVAGLDRGTAGIVSYDRCEKDDAYIGQINMGTASSFCGVNGALWGYHLAKAQQIADGTLQPMFTYPDDYPEAARARRSRLSGQGPVPVYPVWPLLDAAERLYGRLDQSGDSATDLRRFPPMPGAHVICANKDASSAGPGYFWAIIAIAIAEDRETQANLFIEDADVITATRVSTADPDSGYLPTPDEVTTMLKGHMRNVAESIVLCGQDQSVRYREIFMGVKYIFADEDEWGCALTCAPYVTLAKDAIPRVGTGEAAQIIDMTIEEWETLLHLPPLPPVSSEPRYTEAVGIGAFPPDGTRQR
jgi:histidine decarboxylase